MKGESAQMIKGAMVAAPTLAGGTYLLYTQTIIGCFGIMAGATLSVVLTIKAIKEMTWSRKLKQAELDDIQFRLENDLPCRRCSDKKEIE